MSKFRDGMIGPTIILLAICAVITLALSAVQAATKDTIEQGEIENANLVRRMVLPTASPDTFAEVKEISLPDGVLDVYRADTGYVIKSQAKGFDGQVTYMVGIDNDGNVTGINMFDHNETPGLGTKIGDESYLTRYYGNVDPDSVDAITGATRTSNSLKNSLSLAKEAYSMAKEAA